MLFTYTWPPLLAAIGSVVLGVTDSLLIAHYSTSALAGVALGAALYELPINALLGALMAYRILAPRQPQGDDGGLETGGLAIALKRVLPFAALLSCAGVAASAWGFFTLSDATWSAALSYSAGRAPSLVTEIAGATMAIALVAWGRTSVPLIAFLISGPANLLLDAVLIYGLGPAPELGAFGAGIGSTISTILPLFFLAGLIARHRTQNKPSAEVRRSYAEWPKLAWPAVGSAVVDYGGNVVFTLILAASGTAALAGMRFGVQAHLLAFIFVSSVSSAALYILGKVYAEDPNTIRGGAREVRRTFFLIGAAVGFLVLLGGFAAAPFSSPDSDVVSAVRLSTAVVALLCPIAGLTYGNVTLLRLFGMTNREFVSNALGVWCAQISLALLFVLLADGVLPFFGLLAYWALRCAVSHRQVTRHVLARSL